MEVDHGSFAWNRLFQGRVRFFVLFGGICCLLAYFGSSAWRASFPPSQTLPSPYSDDEVQYVPPVPNSELSKDAARSQLQGFRDTKHSHVRSTSHDLGLVTPRIIIEEEEVLLLPGFGLPGSGQIDEGLENSDTAFGGAGSGKHQRPDLSSAQFLIEALKAAGVKEDDPALIFVSRSQNLESEHNTLRGQGQ